MIDISFVVFREKKKTSNTTLEPIRERKNYENNESMESSDLSYLRL